MAVEGIGNLVQNLADRLAAQGSAVPIGPPIVGSRDIGRPTADEDTFTPSRQNDSGLVSEQDAGTFQINRGALPGVSADIPRGQAGADAKQIVSPPQNVPDARLNEEAATPNTAAFSTDANGGQGITGPAEVLEVQNEIQTLNASLPALGLTKDEIQEIDRIASLIKDFNPAAYADLVRQFEALAQQAEQQNIAASAPTSPSGTNGNDARFQIQEILIHLSDSQVAVNGGASSGGQGSTKTSVLLNVVGLQVERVQFTLANASGQSAQVLAPRQSPGPGTANSQPN